MCGGGEEYSVGRTDFVVCIKEKRLLDCQEESEGDPCEELRKRRTYSFQTRTRRRSVVLSWTRVTRACSSLLEVNSRELSYNLIKKRKHQ